MKIIIDANILLSALIRDSTVRRIIITSPHQFYFPEPSVRTVEKYESYIMEKAGFTKGDFAFLWGTLTSYINLISHGQIMPFWQKAKEIMAHVDEEDVIFIAASLSVPNSVIWSEDRHFARQSVVNIINTKVLVQFQA